MKTLVYDTAVDNAEELVARIAGVAAEIRDAWSIPDCLDFHEQKK